MSRRPSAWLLGAVATAAVALLLVFLQPIGQPWWIFGDPDGFARSQLDLSSLDLSDLDKPGPEGDEPAS